MLVSMNISTTCSLVMKVKANPSLPALPVRPTLCTVYRGK